MYLPFFAVQFLFNFDIASHANTGVYLKAPVQTASMVKKNNHELSKTSGQSPVNAKIRLNKRFQPESLIVFHIYHSTQPVQWLTLFKPYPGNTELHSFLLSFNQPLRGPPAVVYYFS